MTSLAWAKRLPWTMLAAVVSLTCLGWLAIARYGDLAGLGGTMLPRQIIWSLLALAAMLGVTIPNYRVACRWSYVLFLMSLALLVAVYFFPPVNNARRWIRFGPVGLQPSEFAKIAYILALARYLMYRENHRHFGGLLLPLALTLLPVALILREPDLGTALIFLPVFFAVLFTAGSRWRDLLGLALVGVIALPALWIGMSREQQSRVTALFAQAGPTDAPDDDTYQLRQAKQMLALGGTWGSLLTGQTVEDPVAYRLPEAQTDFVFCVIGERLGLWGIACTLGLFAILIWRGLAIAAASREPFGRLVATGVTAMLAVEVLINTGMTVGLLPTTGLSLPLVSYGGSGLLAHAIMLGFVLNVGMRPGYEMAGEPFRYA
ncbi:MAG: FtsW/RodA/SpoVE family cell cycle protein [Planctomycetia bacterium]|nr:FtsW/RodA/SpoVE family cell cycle protein [Planctomycetia bacterium]